MNDQRLHPLWWLWIPIGIALVQARIEVLFSPSVLADIHSEGGPHETLEEIFICLAFLVGFVTLVQTRLTKGVWLAVWLGIATLCCFYVAGEEISWGQHIIHWSTPEYWQAINDQGETNLHNTSSWLDQKPRLLLLIGILVGGLIIPALKKFKPELLPERFSIIYPPSWLSVTAGFVIGFYALGKIDKALDDVIILERVSEVEEIYMFYFVLLYLIALRRRIMQN